MLRSTTNLFLERIASRYQVTDWETKDESSFEDVKIMSLAKASKLSYYYSKCLDFIFLPIVTNDVAKLVQVPTDVKDRLSIISGIEELNELIIYPLSRSTDRAITHNRYQIDYLLRTIFSCFNKLMMFSAIDIVRNNLLQKEVLATDYSILMHYLSRVFIGTLQKCISDIPISTYSYHLTAVTLLIHLLHMEKSLENGDIIDIASIVNIEQLDSILNNTSIYQVHLRTSIDYRGDDNSTSDPGEKEKLGQDISSIFYVDTLMVEILKCMDRVCNSLLPDLWNHKYSKQDLDFLDFIPRIKVIEVTRTSNEFYKSNIDSDAKTLSEYVYNRYIYSTRLHSTLDLASIFNMKIKYSKPVETATLSVLTVMLRESLRAIKYQNIDLDYMKLAEVVNNLAKSLSYGYNDSENIITILTKQNNNLYNLLIKLSDDREFQNTIVEECIYYTSQLTESERKLVYSFIKEFITNAFKGAADISIQTFVNSVSRLLALDVSELIEELDKYLDILYDVLAITLIASSYKCTSIHILKSNSYINYILNNMFKDGSKVFNTYYAHVISTLSEIYPCTFCSYGYIYNTGLNLYTLQLLNRKIINERLETNLILNNAIASPQLIPKDTDVTMSASIVSYDRETKKSLIYLNPGDCMFTPLDAPFLLILNVHYFNRTKMTIPIEVRYFRHKIDINKLVQLHNATIIKDDTRKALHSVLISLIKYLKYDNISILLYSSILWDSLFAETDNNSGDITTTEKFNNNVSGAINLFPILENQSEDDDATGIRKSHVFLSFSRHSLQRLQDQCTLKDFISQVIEEIKISNVGVDDDNNYPLLRYVKPTLLLEDEKIRFIDCLPDALFMPLVENNIYFNIIDKLKIRRS